MRPILVTQESSVNVVSWRARIIFEKEEVNVDFARIGNINLWILPGDTTPTLVQWVLRRVQQKQGKSNIFNYLK